MIGLGGGSTLRSSRPSRASPRCDERAPLTAASAAGGCQLGEKCLLFILAAYAATTLASGCSQLKALDGRAIGPPAHADLTASLLLR